MTTTTPARPAGDPFAPAPAPSPARVRLDGDRLVVDRLVTDDPDVVLGARRSAARAAGSLEEWTGTALVVGAKALAVAGRSADVDAVAARVDELGRTLARAADASAARVQAAVEHAADARTGTVAVAVRDALAHLSTDVSAMVAGEDAPLRTAVDRGVRDATAQAAGRVERALADQGRQVRAALSAGDPAGPFASLRAEVLRSSDATRRELGEQLAEIRTLMAVGRERAGMMERTAGKGVAYEQQVVDAVVEVAHGTGDTVEPTGSEVGLVAHAKTGDAVVLLAGPGSGGLGARLVVEAKDATLSGERWRRELEAGRRNRGATGGLGVVRGTYRMPGGARRVHVVDPTNIVVAWEPEAEGTDVLTAAYHLVRASVLQAAVAGAGTDLDRAALTETVRAAYEALEAFDKVDRAAGTARRALDELGKAADGLRAQLHAHLARGLRLLDDAR